MNRNTKPLVSIVTPVYNTEKYLKECIDSIIAQTYENWEYVIVNNCSTDKSLEIAQQYAKADSRIRIYNNSKFLEMFQNWNHMLKQISPKSKYCKIVHADDWIFSNCLEEMVKVAQKYESIGIVGSYRLDENQINLDGLPYPKEFFSGKEICKYQLLGGKYIFGSPTSLLIRSDIIRGKKRFYNESNIHGDQEVCFEILSNADFGFVYQILTYTRRHNDSATTFIKRMKSYILGHFIVFVKYGPQFLTNKEYNNRLKAKTKSYYKYLAKSFFELREKEFWEFHYKELKKIDHPIDPLKLLLSIFREALNFVSTLKKIKYAIRQKFLRKHYGEE